MILSVAVIDAIEEERTSVEKKNGGVEIGEYRFQILRLYLLTRFLTGKKSRHIIKIDIISIEVKLKYKNFLFLFI